MRGWSRTLEELVTKELMVNNVSSFSLQPSWLESSDLTYWDKTSLLKYKVTWKIRD